MELTKEQIQHIENRLIKDGVKYWDIRIEMLDHIISDVENTLNNDTPFKESVQNAMVKLGWKENFNGSNFEGIIQQRTKDIAKKYRNIFWNDLKATMQKPKNILLFALLFLFLFIFKENEIVLKYTLFTFIVSNLILVLFYLYKYQMLRSVQLNFVLQLSTFSISIFNFIIFFPKVLFKYDVFGSEYLFLVLFLIIPISLLGLKFFIKEYQKINTTYQKLISSCN
ncbi:hypothetical protein [uncultured Tenacibaculum sp.]|uniref:hypothetical protein n=1 Tax=uncultured Tenacibaculum sp. TaxID=174713 RepID=UPI0026211D23|nr:hypothetical protein [uncultured Tenacibaculum sp.]